MEQDKIWELYQNAPEFADTFSQAGGRYQYIVSRIPKGAKVLNIGIGRGALEEMLINRGEHVSSLDPSIASVENLRDRLGLGDNAQVGYSQSIPFEDHSFDFVIMSEVLEHLDESVVEDTLIEVNRVLKKNGMFVGTVPADENLQENFVVCPKCTERFHRWGHVQSFSQERLSDTLCQFFNKANVKRVVLVDPKQLNWKGRIALILRKIQAFFGIRGVNQNFYFEACND